MPVRTVRSPKPKQSRSASTRQAATRDDAKQQTRAALVKAALELFAEHGLDVPSLDAICDRAGYTRGAFYVHFKTREDILVAVMDHVGEAFLGNVFDGTSRDGASPDATSPDAASLQPRHEEPPRSHRLHHAVHRFVDAVASGAYPLMATGPGRGPLVRPHQLLDACARSAVVRQRYRELVELSVGAVAGLVSADQADGDVRGDVDPQTVATLSLALVIGAQTMNELGLGLDPAQLARAVERLLTAPSR